MSDTVNDNGNSNGNGRGKKHKLIVGLLVMFIAVGVIGGGWWWYYTSRYVTTDDSRIGGTIVSVSSKVSGKVSELLVDEGDIVKTGQVLVRIDPQDILAQKAQAEAALAAARANHEQLMNGSRPEEIRQARAATDLALANLDNAAKNHVRMLRLFNENAISASQYDVALNAYQVAKEAYKAATEGLNLTVAGAREETIRAAASQVKQAEAALAAISLQHNDTTIVSPVDGIVAVKSTHAGEVLVMGQPMFSIVDSKDLWVNARIEETYIGRLKVGQPVEYTIDGYPNRTFNGKIYEIGNAATSVFALIPTENASNNFTKVTQRIPIKISLPQGSDVVFRPGMSAVIKIHTN